MENLDARNYEELKKSIENGMFGGYPLERLFMKSKYAGLSDMERMLRKDLIDHIAGDGKGYNVNEPSENIISKLGLNRAEYERVLKNLIEKDVVVKNEDGDITVIYPISATPTQHVIKTIDKEFNAMCGIDSLGSTFTFGQDIDIESKCKECGEKIEISVQDGKVKRAYPEKLRILHVDLSNYDTWSCCCCNIMNFFCCKDHYDKWVEKNNAPLNDIFCLNAEEGLQIGKMLFDVEL